MLARKISANSDTSVGKNGRIASLGCAVALIVLFLRNASRRHARPCAGHPRLYGGLAKQDVDGRDKPGHDERESSRDLPSSAFLRILEHHAHRLEFVAETIRFPEIFRLARYIACIDQACDLALVDGKRLGTERSPFRSGLLHQADELSARFQTRRRRLRALGCFTA